MSYNSHQRLLLVSIYTVHHSSILYKIHDRCYILLLLREYQHPNNPRMSYNFHPGYPAVANAHTKCHEHHRDVYPHQNM